MIQALSMVVGSLGNGKPRPAAGKGSLPSPCSFPDALVDEVGALLRGYRFKDGHHLLCSIEIVGLGVLLLTACTFSCTAPALIFFLFLLHNSKIVCIFANENQPSGEVSLPFGTLKADGENRYLYFPNPKINDCDSHFSTRFGFFSSYPGLRDFSLCNLSLITLQRYEKYLNLPNFSRCFFVKSCK